jgi:hypothetical protein
MIEITVDGSRNQNLHFRPLQRVLRGTFDINRVPDPQARIEATRFPRPIPGVRIAVDPQARTAAIIEPLHEPVNAAMRERVEKMGLRLPPEREEFKDIDVPTWLFWMRRAVVNELAKIVEGKFPEIDEARVQKNFITKPQRDPRDGLIDKLVAVLYAGLPAERRQEVAALIEA